MAAGPQAWITPRQANSALNTHVLRGTGSV